MTLERDVIVNGVKTKESIKVPEDVKDGHEPHVINGKVVFVEKTDGNFKPAVKE